MYYAKEKKAYVYSIKDDRKFDSLFKWINVIPGCEFLEFMYKMESLILLLFEKHGEFGPNILQYIHSSLLCNLSLLESFNALFIISSQQISMCESINTEKQELKDDDKSFFMSELFLFI